MNKWYYYTDGHERDNIVKDREDRFLGAYFGYELQTPRWVQVSDSIAVKIEKTDAIFPKIAIINI